MAKLTARFGIQDRITKKLKAIRGEVESLERARNKVNRPMVMRVRDQATKVLKKLHMFVLNDIAKKHEISVQAKDQATKVLTALSGFMKKRMPRTHALFLSANDKASPILQKINRFTQRIIARAQIMTILATDRAMPTIRRIGNFARSTLSKGFQFTVRAVDLASRTVGRVAAFTRSSIPRVYTTTIRVIDMATRPLRMIANAATSTLGLLGVAGGIGGGIVVPIKLVADREDLTTSFEVMLGSKGAADKRMEDLTAFAGRTPLTRDEIFKTSRILQTFTGDALSTSKGMELIGDVAVGTQTDLEETGMWFGRLYDGIKSGRPIGAATSRFQEMGAISGEARERIEKLAESGGDISKIWPKVTKEFSMYNGMMEKMSGNMNNLLLGLRSFVGNSILMPWGEGLKSVFKPALLSFRKWRGEYSFALAEMSSRLKMLGSEFAKNLLNPVKPAFNFISEQIQTLFPGKWTEELELKMKEDPLLRKRFESLEKYRNMTFETRWKLVVDNTKDAIEEWWITTGKVNAARIGEGIGSTYGGFIRSALLTLLGGESKKTGNPFIDAGVTSGKSFVTGFIEALDPIDLLKRIGGKLAGININAGKSVWGKFTGNEEMAKEGSVGGALVANAFFLAFSSVLISKIKPVASLVKKMMWDLPKKGFSFFGKGKSPKSVPKSKSPVGIGGGTKLTRTPKQNQVYSMPWFNKGQKVTQNVPNTKGKGFKFPKGLSKFGASVKRVPIIGTALGALSIASAGKDERAGVVGGVAGGLAGAKGGAVAGAALGSVVPGVGTAIGGAAGGIIGGVGGALGGEWIGNHWETVKEKAADAFNWIGEKASDAKGWIGEKFTDAKEVVSNTLFNSGWWSEKWSNVKEWGSKKLSDTKDWWNGVKKTASETLFSSNWWIEQGGVVYGYLESTIFSGSWWLSKWETVKQWSEGTIFDSAWWSEKWSAVMEWTSEKWDSAIEIWESVKTAFAETVFSSEWWAGNWDAVKAWTQERWDSAITIWNSIQTTFAETVFNSEWWQGKWDSVMSWAQSKWDSAVTIWNSVKEKINETIFNPEWWNSKWDAVKSWTSDKWDKAVSIWESVKTSIGNTLFSSEWWNSKWDSVLSWGKTKLGELGTWVSKKWDGVKESFSKGREKGQSYANYAQGTSFHPGGPAIVGDGGGPELIRYPSGAISLSPGTDTLMNLPRGTEVLSYAKTKKFFNQIPAYADGIGFGGGTPEKAILSLEQVEAATSSSSRSNNATGGTIRDIIVQITGDNHYSDDMDAEKVGVIAWNTIKKKLEEEYFEGGEMLVDG